MKEVKLLHPKGFIYEPIVNSDALFGSAFNLSAKGFKGVVLNESADWQPYLFDKIYSNQAPSYETSACVSHGTLNAIELLNNRIHGRLLDWSDRFVAKGSGTDPNVGGNTPKAVADFIRHSWSPTEEDWPTSAAKTQDEFYAEIPQALFDKALSLKGDYQFGYERVNPDVATMKEALKYSPLGISCILTRDSDGEIYKPEGFRDGHYLVLMQIRDDGKFVLLDSYGPDFIKVTKPFLPEMAMRYALDYEKYNLYVQLLEALKKLWEALKKHYKEITPSFDPEIDPKTLPMNRSRIEEWALAIQHAEGGKPNDLNTRLKNPGSLKYTPYTASLGGKKGPTSADGGYFCIFDTYADGFEALSQLLTDACMNKLKSYRNFMTLDEFSKVYANVPLGHGYQKSIAERLNVPLTIKIKELL